MAALPSSIAAITPLIPAPTTMTLDISQQRTCGGACVSSADWFLSRCSQRAFPFEQGRV